MTEQKIIDQSFWTKVELTENDATKLQAVYDELHERCDRLQDILTDLADAIAALVPEDRR